MSVKNFFRRNAGMLAATAGLMTMGFLAPKEVKGQSDYTDGRRWSFSLGVAGTPGTNEYGKTDINFYAHGTTPGAGEAGSFVGEHNFFEGGFRYTGKTYKEGIEYSQIDNRKGYMGWAYKFSTAYLSWIIGQRFKLGEKSDVIIGQKTTANMFMGGQSNFLNFAHLDFAATAKILIATKGGLGFEAGVTQSFAQIKNNSIYNQWAQQAASYKQIQPPLIVTLGAAYAF